MNKVIALLLTISSLPVSAQWLNHADSRTPRSKDGKPNLTAPAPRLGGKQDLSGLWQADRTPTREFESVLGEGFATIQVDAADATKNALSVFWGTKPEDEPLRPETAAILMRRMENPLSSPQTQCLPVSIPMAMLMFSFKMIQTPQEIVLLSEVGDPARQIHTDGRSLPKDPSPSWIGNSVGRWEGETLVVETNGLNDLAWLDIFGHPRSESMHITERYHRRDFGHMDLEVTFEDSKYYTRPFSFKTGLKLIPDSEVLEFVCAENEKDRTHLGK